MLRKAKFSILGVTAGRKYLVTPHKEDYYNVMLDNEQMAIRHKSLFEGEKDKWNLEMMK